MIRIEREKGRKDGQLKQRRKIDRKAEGRIEKPNVPDIWEDNKEACTKRNERIGQRIRQEQKKEKCGKSSWTNFLKRKALPISVIKKREENESRKKRISYKTRRGQRR